MRALLLSVLAFVVLCGTAEARPHLRDCPNMDGSEFTYHVQVSHISCGMARYVIRGVTFNEDTFEFEGPSWLWNCRERDGAGADGRRLRCTMGRQDIRWTSRLF